MTPTKNQLQRRRSRFDVQTTWHADASRCNINNTPPHIGAKQQARYALNRPGCKSLNPA